MKVAVIEGGIVANIIEADEAFAKEHVKDYRVLKDGEWCDLGAAWDGKKFTAAKPVKE